MCGASMIAWLLVLRKTGSVALFSFSITRESLPPLLLLHGQSASHKYVFCVLLGEISALIFESDPNAFLDKKFDTTPSGCQPQEVCFHRPVLKI